MLPADMTFVLSLDTEIAWGTYGETALAARAPAFEAYRPNLLRLIDLLDTYDIAATWAVVAGLLGTVDVPEPTYTWSAAPSGIERPSSNSARAVWYTGVDVLAAIEAASAAHEIGTHTYTHALADATTRALFDAQLRTVTALHAKNGLPAPRSLVYPQNRIAHLDLLAQHGITHYRGVATNWYNDLPAKRALHLLDRALAITPPTYSPTHDSHRLVDVTASMFLMSYDGVRGYIPTASRIAQARRGLEKAARNGEVFHLWFHPFNLGSSPAMFDALEGILRIVAAMRDAGKIDVKTMGEIQP